jgi:hypothetical protein
VTSLADSSRLVVVEVVVLAEPTEKDWTGVELEVP